MRSPGAVFLFVPQRDKFWRNGRLFYTCALSCLSKVQCAGDQLDGKITEVE